MNISPDDWRLMGQEEGWMGVELCLRSYRAYSEEWDHDHCEFCFRKLAEPDHIPDALHIGYVTLDEYHWICPTCFEDFKEHFRWTLVECES